MQKETLEPWHVGKADDVSMDARVLQHEFPVACRR
jgi:hypothetical protein